jgi:hypothetical protein
MRLSTMLLNFFIYIDISFKQIENKHFATLNFNVFTLWMSTSVIDNKIFTTYYALIYIIRTF